MKLKHCHTTRRWHGVVKLSREPFPIYQENKPETKGVNLYYMYFACFARTTVELMVHWEGRSKAIIDYRVSILIKHPAMIIANQFRQNQISTFQWWYREEVIWIHVFGSLWRTPLAQFFELLYILSKYSDNHLRMIIVSKLHQSLTRACFCP